MELYNDWWLSEYVKVVVQTTKQVQFGNSQATPLLLTFLVRGSQPVFCLFYVVYSDDFWFHSMTLEEISLLYFPLLLECFFFFSCAVNGVVSFTV